MSEPTFKITSYKCLFSHRRTAGLHSSARQCGCEGLPPLLGLLVPAQPRHGAPRSPHLPAQANAVRVGDTGVRAPPGVLTTCRPLREHRGHEDPVNPPHCRVFKRGGVCLQVLASRKVQTAATTGGTPFSCSHSLRPPRTPPPLIRGREPTGFCGRGSPWLRSPHTRPGFAPRSSDPAATCPHGPYRASLPAHGREGGGGKVPSSRRWPRNSQGAPAAQKGCVYHRGQDDTTADL